MKIINTTSLKKMDTVSELKIFSNRYQKLKVVIPNAREEVRQAQEELSNPDLTAKEHANQLRYMRATLANLQSLEDEYDMTKRRMVQLAAARTAELDDKLRMIEQQYSSRRK